MSTIEVQLRAQLESELEGKQGELEQARDEYAESNAKATKAQKVIATLMAEVDELRTKISRFDEVFGTKPTKKAQGAKASSSNNSRAAQGRREVASGSRPKIRDAMRTVMGTQIMNAKQIHDLLEDKGWLPNSSDPLLYIKYLLSSLDDFERVEGRNRGLYRVVPATLEAEHEGTNGVQAAMMSETDEILRDAGVLPAN